MSADRPYSVGQVVWTPTEDAREHSILARYLVWLQQERGLDFTEYDELWRWSVTDLDGFWSSLWDFFEIHAETPYERVLGSREMPGAEWFPGARLNYAEHMLGRDEDTDAVAVVARSQSRDPFELTFGELRDQVARARAGLQRLGVGPGDRVVAYLPNIPETLIAFLATASLGAVWATCPPEFGPRSVLDRLGQLEPSVLLAVDGYRWGETRVDRREQVAEMRAGLPSLRTVVHVPYGGGELPGRGRRGTSCSPSPARSSSTRCRSTTRSTSCSRPGTTGLPKAIVHGHGGILIEHLKNHGLSWDLRPGDRLLWFTTTAWMMWNALVSTLLLRASIVMIDGNPALPRPRATQWRMVEETRRRCSALSPAFTMACRKAGARAWPRLRPLVAAIGLRRRLAAPGGLRTSGSTSRSARSVLLNVGSGGTDVCTGIVQGMPAAPGLRRARSRAAASPSTSPRSTPTGTRSSASSASS